MGCRFFVFNNLNRRIMTNRFRLTSQLAVLKDIAANYKGKTIDNIIQQMEARLEEIIKQETI